MPLAKGTTVVTGANGGLGSPIARQLSSLPRYAGYHNVYAVRDATSAAALRESTSSSENTTHASEVISLDLTNLDSVRRVAESINSRVANGDIPPIQALVLNAGFQDFGKQVWTPDGFDVTFSANYLGHWLLTLLLLKSMNKECGRIVVIGSQAHDPRDKRNDRTGAFATERDKTLVHDKESFEAIARGTWSSAKQDPSWRSGFRRYGASKLFLVMMIHELQRRMDHDPVLSRVCVLGVDPGTMSTGLQRRAAWFVRVVLLQIVYPIIAFLFSSDIVKSTHKAASQVLAAAFDAGPPVGEFPKAGYFSDGKPCETSEESRDLHTRNLVGEGSVEYAHLQPGETILKDWQ
ncbi:putative short-chain dehydrogenase [Xylariaceae sp. FL0594]|nr:putative short-chain dehydrogenase [Xylariaceae sp. FL0594]